MLIPVITTSIHFARVAELTITIDWIKPPRIPNPTEYEWNTCPATFRCYSCLERKGKKHHFGGLILDKRICQECYPYLDEATVGGIIRFDMKHGFRVD